MQSFILSRPIYEMLTVSLVTTDLMMDDLTVDDIGRTLPYLRSL